MYHYPTINLYLEAAVLVQPKTTTTETCQQISQKLQRTLYTDTSNVRREFSKLVDETQTCVTQAVDINTLKHFVARKCLDLGDYPEEAAKESKECESVDNLFTVLAEHKVNVFYDTEMIDLIITKFCSGTSCHCHEMFILYEESLNKHLKRRVCEHSEYKCGSFDGTKEISQVPETGHLLFVTDKTWSINDDIITLYKLGRRLSQILKCQIELTSVHPGSLRLYFRILRNGNEHNVVMDFNLPQLLQLINSGIAKVQTTNSICSMEDECKCVVIEII